MPKKSCDRNRMNLHVRRRFLVGLLTGAACLVVLPMAVAWACAPATGQIDFNRTSYSAGQTVEVWGNGFARSNPVVLTLQPPSGPARRVAPEAATDQNGYFDTRFALPADAQPGTYALQARTDEPGIGAGHAPTRPTTASHTFKVPPPAAAKAPAPSPAPAVVAPPMTKPAPVVDNRAKRSRAVRRCRSKYRVLRRFPVSKRRTLRRKKARCIRSARKRYPIAPSLQ